MEATVKDVLRECAACQAERVRSPPKEPYRAATRAPLPGRGWSIDLAGPFPKDMDNNTYLAVGVDCTSKWIEARPI
jgi:hypothetical protein